MRKTGGAMKENILVKKKTCHTKLSLFIQTNQSI